jgi:hypothetical protein
MAEQEPSNTFLRSNPQKISAAVGSSAIEASHARRLKGCTTQTPDVQSKIKPVIVGWLLKGKSVQYSDILKNVVFPGKVGLPINIAPYEKNQLGFDSKNKRYSLDIKQEWFSFREK